MKPSWCCTRLCGSVELKTLHGEATVVHVSLLFAELDTLYEAKRQMVSVFKKQRDDFNDGREKRRHESFKKRIEEKQAIQAALRQEM